MADVVPKGMESGLAARPTMNLPNSLTVLRIFFVPVLIVVLLTRSPNIVLWGFPMHFEVWGVLILLAAATDTPPTTTDLRRPSSRLRATRSRLRTSSSPQRSPCRSIP